MKRVNLLLGVALLLPYLWLAVTLDPAHDSGHDFMENIWVPGRLLLLGHNPYQPPPGVAADLMSSYPAAVAAYRQAIPSGGLFDGGGDEYAGAIYPLWALLIGLPFAVTDFPVGQRLWAVANALMLVGGLALAMLAWRRPTTTPTQFWLAYAGLVGCGVVYLPLLTSQNGGEHEGLLVGLTGLLLYADQQRRSGRAGWGWVAGAALAALTIKPQITGLLLLLYLLVWLRGRRWSLLGSFVLTSLVLYLIPLLLRPAALSDWLATLARRQQLEYLAMVSASWWGVAYAVVGRSGWTLVAVGLVGLSLLLLVVPWWRAMQHDDAGVALPLTLIVTMAVSSYILVYHETILLVAVAPLWLVMTQSAGRRRFYWLAALLLWQVMLPLLLLRAGYALGGGYPFIIQPLVLLAIYYFRPVANQQAATPATVLPQGSS